MSMKLAEIVRRSQGERYAYPDIFTDNCGLDIVWPEGKLHAVPSWGHRPSNKVRRVTVQVSSFRGVSIGAIHYYGMLSVQGVNMAHDDKPSCSTMNCDCEKQNPLSCYTYKLRLTRPITQEEIDIDQELGHHLARFPYQDVGDLTPCWNTEEEILEFAKEVFKARFQGKWELYMEYWDGHVEKIDV